jgi:hypothetical protein
LQDNGNVYNVPETYIPGVPRQANTVWRRHVGGDGGLNRIVDGLAVLLNWDNTNVNLGLSQWDEKARRFAGGPGSPIPADDSPSGVAANSVELVQAPAFARADPVQHPTKQLLMYAVASVPSPGGTSGLYGLFGDPDKSHQARLLRLGTLNGSVVTTASFDGSTLLLGTAGARIFSFASGTGVATEQTLPAGLSGNVTRLEALPGNRAYALVGGQILRSDGKSWGLAEGYWRTFAADPESGRLFAATDADVFVSDDDGGTWVDASYGLPARPHCTDLRVAADPVGGRDLCRARDLRLATR